jgi:drug/metabolite transporter (DMT)-like permease
LLLLIQPMTTVALAAVALGERPSPLQLAGCAVIVLGVLYGSRRSQPTLAEAVEQEEQVPKTSTV